MLANATATAGPGTTMGAMTEPDLSVARDRSDPPSWVVLSRPATDPVAPDGSEIRIGRVVAWVCLSIALALVAVGVAGVIAARNLAEREAVNDAAVTADLIAEAVVQPALRDSLVEGDAEAVAALDEAVRDYLETSAITRVKIWTGEGEIVYSDEPALIGETFDLGDDERGVLSDPQTRSEISDTDEPENRFERGSGRMLEVYRPVWTPDGTTLLFETYAPYDEVDARSGELWRGFAGVTVSTLLFFALLLLPIGWRLVHRVRAMQEQREALLEKAVDASLEERRRIAGTLHDGVVQELAAASFTVSGAAARADHVEPVLAEDLRAVAGTLRTSIGSLRSLLVDIYPATLEASGLGEALGDLVSSLRSRGLQVLVEIDHDDQRLVPEQQRLVFRIAQECLQNVRSHSGASTVTLGLHDRPGEVVLDVVDDGVGFDPEAALTQPRAGHFGVRVLADVASGAGAELSLSTAPGAGCHWRLRVPVP